MKVIILAAGKGSRLGEPSLPKPLTKLSNGNTVLGQQLQNLALHFNLNQVILVVGYQKEKIMDQFSNCLFVFNPNYEKENTSKSLLRALNTIDEDVLWLNGDVVFHPSILKPLVGFSESAMVVNEGPVGEEEVKYRINLSGDILEISKEVKNAQGEALGINAFKASDLKKLRLELEKCQPSDYFEKGIEECIKKGMTVKSYKVNPAYCTEIDFPEDLIRANQLLKSWN